MIRSYIVPLSLLAVVACGSSPTETPPRVARSAPPATSDASSPETHEAATAESARAPAFREVTLSTDPVIRKLWVYVPAGHAPKVPLILIAPAGSPLMWGMGLAEADRAEHLPYVAAGFAVVAYTVDGAVPDVARAKFGDVQNAARAFKDAKGGVANARAALDWAMANVPNVDPERVYAVGHSSAATIALDVASADPRVRAVAAFAPIPNPLRSISSAPQMRVLGFLERFDPGFESFMAWTAPEAHVAELRVPALVFQSEEDTTLNMADTSEYVAALKRSNPNVTFVRAAHGDHYASMIQEGIPDAVQWLGSLAKP